MLPGLRDGVPGLPGLRRHRPRLFLPALRHRNRHGRPAAGLSRLCGPCAVTWTAGRLLDDGTGSVGPPLKPLAGALAATASPAATLEWLEKAAHP